MILLQREGSVSFPTNTIFFPQEITWPAIWSRSCYNLNHGEADYPKLRPHYTQMSTEFIWQIQRGHTGRLGGNFDVDREISMATWLYPFSHTLAINTAKTCTSRDKGQPWVSTELSTLIPPVRAGFHTWLLSFLLLCFSLADEEPWAVFPLAVPSLQIIQARNQINSWVHLVAHGPSPSQSSVAWRVGALLTCCSLHFIKEPH